MNITEGFGTISRRFAMLINNSYEVEKVSLDRLSESQTFLAELQVIFNRGRSQENIQSLENIEILEPARPIFRFDLNNQRCGLVEKPWLQFGVSTTSTDKFRLQVVDGYIRVSQRFNSYESEFRFPG